MVGYIFGHLSKNFLDQMQIHIILISLAYLISVVFAILSAVSVLQYIYIGKYGNMSKWFWLAFKEPLYKRESLKSTWTLVVLIQRPYVFTPDFKIGSVIKNNKIASIADISNITRYTYGCCQSSERNNGQRFKLTGTVQLFSWQQCSKNNVRQRHRNTV